MLYKTIHNKIPPPIFIADNTQSPFEFFGGMLPITLKGIRFGAVGVTAGVCTNGAITGIVGTNPPESIFGTSILFI